MDGFDEYDRGYTPTRLVARPLNEIFLRPWDGRPNKGVAVKIRKTHPQSVDADQLLKQLTDIVTECAEGHNCETVDGMNHTWQCPNRERCGRFWDKVSNKTCLRKLAPEVFEKYRAEFEDRIKPK